eukprot:TRINITY_DN2863_c0_g1_i1.p1 TRINITY_DN2863_c0_g1~~TRINITY_DN2863_c0_g1_i1.p1  ORF type:complete len:123 (-),score=25.66 TRINITY_DN2863_c0_g1_i1:116-484(-)
MGLTSADERLLLPLLEDFGRILFGALIFESPGLLDEEEEEEFGGGWRLPEGGGGRKDVLLLLLCLDERDDGVGGGSIAEEGPLAAGRCVWDMFSGRRLPPLGRVSGGGRRGGFGSSSSSPNK